MSSPHPDDLIDFPELLVEYRKQFTCNLAPVYSEDQNDPSDFIFFEAPLIWNPHVTFEYNRLVAKIEREKIIQQQIL
jgi:hypothetical protein